MYTYIYIYRSTCMNTILDRDICFPLNRALYINVKDKYKVCASWGINKAFCRRITNYI